MLQTKRIMAATAASAVLALLAGCSEEKAEAVPELPKRFCWGAFTPKEVSALLPAGKAATHRFDPFGFAERTRQVSCNVYIDGNHGFSAVARFEDEKELIDWSSWDPAKPDPINMGTKGIVWNNGAATYFPCTPTANASPSQGKYLELRVDVFVSRKEDERDTLSKVLEKFMAFAQKELKCT
ncbi:hypothetical protein AB0L80_31350 [Streptomyces sp. NPDC052069]|uniref:hypothetical protein n=1 Tax=unclassified Streptomyces TaxID=2593676 RepID=UPI00342CEDD3